MLCMVQEINDNRSDILVEESSELKSPVHPLLHDIHYTSQAETWFCSKCGIRGLDGEDSPRDVACSR